MDFLEYRIQFIDQARGLGYQDSEIENLLDYAQSLHEKGLPIIYDQEHLSLLLGCDYSFLLAISNSQQYFYRPYEIPKKHGGIRLILEPYPDLKDIQTWVLKNILEAASKDMVSPLAKAFVPGKNLRDNARFHRNTNIVVALDLHDFFGSIKESQVYEVFSKMGYKKTVVVFLTQLCTLGRCLPQGAPTSPMLSNMVFYDLDQRLFHYCRLRNIRYTRYADDLTFSGEYIDVDRLVKYVRMLVGTKRFKLNDEKTKVMRKGACQMVTGVVVNKILQTPKKYRKKVRQEIYYCMKYGIANHMSRISLPTWITKESVYIHHLLGKVNYILQINPKDEEFIKYREWLKNLL